MRRADGPPPRARGDAARRARLAALLVGLAALAGCGPVVTFAPVERVDLERPAQTSVVRDAEGGVLAELHGEVDREVVDLEDVPDVLADAVVAVEDVRFRDHGGVDTRAFARAVARNLRSGEPGEGGSTITQQLAKNTVTGSETSLRRKVREASVALRLEAQHSKDEILERYLNEVYFGRGAYGVQAASQRYFSRDVGDLDLPRAALLAGLLRSPSNYDPLHDPEAARDRRDLVLELMQRHGFADPEDARAAAAADLGLNPRSLEEPWVAPYFVDHVLRLLQHDERFAALGATPTERAEALFRGGLDIQTTLDPGWQQAAEDAAAATVPEPEDPSAAVVALDPATGGIAALVGGRDWDDEADPAARYNLATQAARQPASSFKPIVLAAALEAGWTLDDRLEAPGSLELGPVAGEPEPWEVSNYGDVDLGTISLREATARSSNVAFAQVVQDLGAAPVADLANDLGIERELPALRSLALGAYEVSVLEMATVQATLASGGLRRDPTAVVRITGPDDEVRYDRGTPEGERVLDETTAWLVTEALQDVVERGTGERAALERPLAGKTGTSQRSADAWFTGYTPDLAAATWIGFPEATESMVPPATRARVEGGTWPAELFGRFGLAALADAPALAFEVPDTQLVELAVDVRHGCRPTGFTPPEHVEERAFLLGEEPTEDCGDTGEPVSGDVPDVTGLEPAEATTRLEEDGFAVAEEPLYDPTRPPGIVIEQRPRGGSARELPDGWHATLRVSSADRTPTPVPDVLADASDDAVATLREAGFVVDLTSGCPDGEDTCTGAARRPGQVWDQSPGGGVERPAHDRVELRAYPEP